MHYPIHLMPFRLSLFWYIANVQDKCLTVFPDTGSIRNLVSENFCKSLSFEVHLTPAGATLVVAGNAKAVLLVGWGIFKFEIAEQTFYHEIVVVKDLPIDFLIGGEVMRSHAANIQFDQKDRNNISFCHASWSLCHENHRVLREMNSFGVLSNFGRRCPTHLHSLSISPPASIDIDSTPDDALPIPHVENAEIRNAKYSGVQNELKIHDLTVTPQVKHAIIGVVHRCLDAFAKMLMM